MGLILPGPLVDLLVGWRLAGSGGGGISGGGINGGGGVTALNSKTVGALGGE